MVILEAFIKIVFIVGLILLAAFGYYLFLLFRNRWKVRHIPGPPNPSFLFGHVPLMSNRFTRFYLFTNWGKEYGPVYKVYVMHDVMVFCSTRESAKLLLTDSTHLKSEKSMGRLHSILGVRFMGWGLVTAYDHQKWSQRRAIMDPAFRRGHLAGMMDCFNEMANRLVQHLVPLADGKTEVSMLKVFHNVTLDVISNAAFSYDTNALETDNPFSDAIYASMEAMSYVFNDPLKAFDPRKKARTEVTRIKNGLLFLRETGNKIVRDRIAEITAGHDTPSDVLDIALRNMSGSGQYSVEEMIDEFTTFFIAGQETTANALGFLLKELCHHPKAYRRLQEEVDKFRSTHDLTFLEQNDLEYTNAAFKEALRLYPPVGGTIRCLAEDTMVSGYTVPEGTDIVVHFPSVQRSSCARGEEFIPDRFLSDPSDPEHPPLFSFLPFSLGQRSCIGQQFALIEAKVLLFSIMKRFDFKLVEGQSFEIEEVATSRFRGGVQCTLTLRD